ncbi:MAG: hypothetical protein IT437_14065 [Phycisphaerales bacterium]|nr:hypothetical protein [Phycisphaerales bacterium]
MKNRVGIAIPALAAAGVCVAAGLALAPPGGPGDGVDWVVNGNNIYFAGGNVGVGIVQPVYPLHVQTNAGSRAIFGIAAAQTGVTNGVYGQALSSSGRGVLGLASAGSGNGSGVFGQANSTTGRGVTGYAGATGGANYGVLGQSNSTGGRGVFGLANAATGLNYGVFGQSNSAAGYAGFFQGRGFFSGNVGIGASPSAWRLQVTGQTFGVVGSSTATTGDTEGVRGVVVSPDGAGVHGMATATGGDATGVAGESKSTLGAGVTGFAHASSGENFGVLGSTNSSIGWAVFGIGDIGASGTKQFHIDHPLDPANKYLNHYCAEGPEPVLIYRGSVVLDPQGAAWVELPAYFDAMNKDVQYQLTPVGGPAPMLHVASEVSRNQFRIAGGSPGLKVSWTVTGTRNDPYVRARPRVVEQEKPPELRGKYLHPEFYGAGDAARIGPRAGVGGPQDRR